MSLTHWYLQNGTRIAILNFLDDHCRYLLHIHAQQASTGPDFAETLHQLISQYGPPAPPLTDNVLVFTTRLACFKGSSGGFEKLLQTYGIIQKNGRPGHPQTQDKIERFHQTLKKWLTARPRPVDLDELNTWLRKFQTWYNTARPTDPSTAPHTALPKATPNGEHTRVVVSRHEPVL